MLGGGGLGRADGGSCLFRSVKVLVLLLTSLALARSAALPTGGTVATVGWPETHFADRETKTQSRLIQYALGQAVRLTVPRSW